MSNIYSSPTGPRLAGLHDKFFVGPPPPSSQPNDEDTDMPTYYSGSERTEVATYVQEVHFSNTFLTWFVANEMLTPSY